MPKNAVHWICMVALLLWSQLGFAAHLPPGLEPRVVALLEGPELVELGMKAGDIAISAQRIAVSVASKDGQSLGTLQLVQAGQGAKAVLRSRSFDLVWHGQVTPAVTQWLQAVVKRDTGVWWDDDEELLAAEATEAPRVAPTTLLFSSIWLLFLALLLVSVVIHPLRRQPLLVFGVVCLPVVAAASWSTSALVPLPAWETAAAGRPADAIDALGAVLRWQFRLQPTLGSEALAAAIAGLCVLVGQQVLQWLGRGAVADKRGQAWGLATTGILAAVASVLIWHFGPGAARWLLAPLLTVACVPVAMTTRPTVSPLLTRWLAVAILFGAGPWSLGWAVVCSVLLAWQTWNAWKLQRPDEGPLLVQSQQ